MIKVEVWSDINCPFCYIGKRHLESALQGFKEDLVEVEWKSFELDPNGHPPKGANAEELLAKKYGRDVQWAREMNANMTKMAQGAGLGFHLEKLVPANSFDAHRLIHLAKKFGKQGDMKERLLRAKFVEGVDISDKGVIAELAKEQGLPIEEVQKVLDHDLYSKEVRQDEEMAMKLGISGVPFFVVNQKYALSGAQPVETFKEVLEKVAAE
jgi:predicted DsbA family dithiol-disulfide isomerase